jgi:hypothetical protein
MERSEIPGYAVHPARLIPDYAALHPGYQPEGCKPLNPLRDRLSRPPETPESGQILLL